MKYEKTADELREKYSILDKLYEANSLQNGLSETAIAQCLSSNIPKEELATAFEAFAMTAPSTSQEYRFAYGCATAIAELVRGSGVGFEQLNRIIEAKLLSSNELTSLGQYYIGTCSPERLAPLINLFRPENDPSFHSFISNNMMNLAPLISEVSSHLLEPDKGRVVSTSIL